MTAANETYFFNGVRERNDLGESPAAVSLDTGILYINPSQWQGLSKEKRVFILLHELGHYVLQTRDEFEADEFAHEMYSRMGYSLKQSVFALSETFDDDNEEHRARLHAQINRAYASDKAIVYARGKRRERKRKRKEEKRASKYGRNPKTGKAYTKKEAKKIRRFGTDPDTGNPLSKKQNKHQRKNRKLDNKESKIENKGERIRGRADSKRIKSQGRADAKAGRNKNRQLRSENGNTFGESMGEAMGGIFGGQGEQGSDSYGNSPVLQKSGMFGGIGGSGGDSTTMIVVVLIAVAVGYAMLNQKQAA